MALETELKLIGVDFARVREALRKAGARFLTRAFEQNLVFDDAGRSLRSRSTLLRLRSVAGGSRLTLKRPVAQTATSALKVFDEIETGVADFEAMRAVLEGLGFSAAFAYEKVRETWRSGDVFICLDHLPFGDFVELEGPEPDILACLDRLGLAGFARSKETYHALNLAQRRAQGLAPDESFVFAASERARLLQELASD